MPRFAAVILVILGLLSSAPPAVADKRIALVIGNSSYRHVHKLEGADRDASAVAAMLKGAGFEVGEALLDVDIRKFRAALREFHRRAETADLAVVYYSGHGIEVNGSNYLIPIDAELARDLDVEDEAVTLERVLKAIEPARFLRLLVVDACSENPFLRAMKSRVNTRAIARGLAPLAEPRGLPNDTVIVYSASAGTSCLKTDDGRNPFADALVQHLPKPGIDIYRALHLVRQETMSRTSRRQEPGIYGTFGGQSISIAPREDPASDFTLAKQRGTREALLAFLSKHTRGFEVDEARALLARMDREGSIAAIIGRGRNYALIIGNQNYRDRAYPTLDTPHADVKAVADALIARYGFSTRINGANGLERDLVLLDATADDIGEALDFLAASLGKDDRLLVYYAGHGIYEKVTDTAYWVPIDARQGRRTRDLLAATEITRALRRVPARSVLVVSDSCYSGGLFRDAPADPSPADQERDRTLIKLAERPSRVLIASGGTEPVLDGGGSGHSIFARKFLEALKSPIAPAFSALDLYTAHLRPAVAGNAQQVPQYATLRDAGHDTGDFVFVVTGAAKPVSAR